MFPKFLFPFLINFQNFLFIKIFIKKITANRISGQKQFDAPILYKNYEKLKKTRKTRRIKVIT